MSYTTNGPSIPRKPLTGPLAGYIRPLGDWMLEQGYRRRTCGRYVFLAAEFSRWLKSRGVLLQQVSSEHPRQYLRHRARRWHLACFDAHALKCLMELLRRDGIVEPQVTELTPRAKYLVDFADHLRDKRGLAPRSITNHTRYVGLFLNARPDIFDLNKLRASDVTNFIQRQALPEHPCRSKQIANAVRSFLRYAHYHGDIHTDLTPAIPCVPNWQLTSILRVIPAEQIRKALASCDRRSAMGRRDYAVMLLLSRLGMRSCEVVHLQLDDIDWKAGVLTIHGKGRRADRLPLPPDVGKAISAYLQHGRPQCAVRQVFVSINAPIQGLSEHGSLTSLVRRVLKRAGVDNSPSKGTHQFRYGLASEMLSRGVRLTEIQQVLRHRSPRTTMMYTKIDINSLRALSMPWPGGAP